MKLDCGAGHDVSHAEKNRLKENTMKENNGIIIVTGSNGSLARENTKDLPVDVRLQDYRELQGNFDRILSIGMFEHVGYKNYRMYMQTVRCL
jgi:cyclopropane-fatty-acyl-phospholipid synthase